MIYSRDILKPIRKELTKQEILILLGSRQVGKTTILKIIEKDFLKQKKCLFLDLDIEMNLEYFSSYENILDYIRLQGFNPDEDHLFLLLDEFQRVKKAGRTLKNLYDHHKNIKIIATGSSSIEINKAISESMAGRKIVFRIFPLTFKEYLVFKNEQNLITFFDSYKPGQNISSTIFHTFEKHCIEKIIFGSYPAVVLENNLERKGQKINDILNSYLRKDIREQFNITDIVLFKKILELSGIYISNLSNINKIANQLGTYYRKVQELINIANETYIIDLLRPFFLNRKNEIVRNPKLYFEDTGIRNFLIKNMNTDILLRNDWGALIENFVYNELYNKIDIFTEIKFWRTKNGTEIDFLLIKNQKILPVEIKSGSISYIPKSLLIFCKTQNLKYGVVVNKDFSACIEQDGITFIFIPYFFGSKIIEVI